MLSNVHRKANARRWARQNGPEFVRQDEPDPAAWPGLVGADVWVNNAYMVLVRKVATPWGEARHLHIQRLDTKPVRKWRDLQAIKNSLAGPDAVAVEMFPAKGEVVDEHHHYHLWVLPEGLKLPFTIRRA